MVAGYPVVDVKVKLYDGSYHTVDSSELAFKIAGSLGWNKAMGLADPVLLEPIMNVEVTAPEENMGDIMGDLSSRRGRPQGSETVGEVQVIRAQVPLVEMLSYAPQLRSMTAGRGSYTMEFDHYEEVPASRPEGDRRGGCAQEGGVLSRPPGAPPPSVNPAARAPLERGARAASFVAAVFRAPPRGSVPAVTYRDAPGAW